MHTEIEPERMAVWELFIRTFGALIKTFEQELAEGAGLPITWYDVLIQLHEAPDGRLRMQALADSVVLSRSGVTRLIDRMEKAGLVRREPSREDRRGSYAALTEDGRGVFSRAQPIHHRGIYEHFTRHLDDADVRALRTALAKVRNAGVTRPAAAS